MVIKHHRTIVCSVIVNVIVRGRCIAHSRKNLECAVVL